MDGSLDASRAVTYTVVIVDDNPVLCRGLAELIGAQPEFEIAGTANDCERGATLIGTEHPRLVLLDVGLAIGDAGRMLAEAVRRDHSLRVLLVGLLPATADLVALMRAGACGYVMKTVEFASLCAAMRAALAGHQVFPERIATSILDRVVSDQRDADDLRRVKLTPRELEIVALVGAGHANKVIASRLNISIHTVKSHMSNILEKLAVRSRLEIILQSQPRAAGESSSDM